MQNKKNINTHSGYFEGILQLRNPSPEAVDFIYRKVRKNAGKGIWVSREKQVAGGIDFYLSSNKYLQKLARELRDEFGAEIKTGAQLFSKNRQTGKELYRVNALVKMPEYKKNDVVKIGDDVIIIKSTGKRLTGINIVTGKKASYSMKNIKPEVMEKKETYASKTTPAIEVIHPETYESIAVENKDAPELKKLKNGEKIKVVVSGGRVWIV